jgi:hypothetical protein
MIIVGRKNKELLERIKIINRSKRQGIGRNCSMLVNCIN